MLQLVAFGTSLLRFSRKRSDYAKVDEIVQVSYAHARPRVQEWSALRTWQAYDEYNNE